MDRSGRHAVSVSAGVNEHSWITRPQTKDIYAFDEFFLSEMR